MCAAQRGMLEQRRSAAGCNAHPEEKAGWGCTAWGRQLCPDGVAPGEVDRAVFEVCVHCEGPVRVRTVSGSTETYGALLVSALRVPIGLPTLGVGVAVWMLVYMALGAPGWAVGVTWGGVVAPVVW